MLERLPRALPPLHALVADLGQPSAAALASATGHSARTWRVWLASDEAPRVVLLALWPLTRWGMSAADCQAHNAAAVHAALADALRRELVRAQATIDGLAELLAAQDAAANTPIFHRFVSGRLGR